MVILYASDEEMVCEERSCGGIFEVTYCDNFTEL